MNGSFNDAVKRGLIRYEELKGAAVRRLTLDNARNSGMTLVELMVAVGITAIIMILSTMIFMSQYKSYRTSHGTKTIETDIQKAVEYVRDDVTLAGWGVKPQMAFYFVDGGSSSPDQVYANDISLMDPNNTKQMQVLVDSFGLTSVAAVVSIRVILPSRARGKAATTPPPPTTIWTSTAIFPPRNSISVPVLVWASGSNATRFRTTDSSGNLLNPGFAVEKYVTPAVRYSVDNSTTATPSLLRWARDTGGAQPMAEGVVDLQVIYGDSSTNPASTSDHFGNGTLINPDNSTAIHPRYGKRGCTAGTDCQMGNFDSSSISWVNLYVVTRSAERTQDPTNLASAGRR